MDDDPPLRTDSMAMQQERIQIGGTDSIYKAYFLGLNFREYPHNSYGPKIWYSTTSTSICWILDFPLADSHNPCSIISMAMGPFSFNDSADQPAASSTPFCGADGQVIWEDHPPIHDWLVVEPPTPLKNMS